MNDAETVCAICWDTRCPGADGISPCQMVAGVNAGEYIEAMEGQPDEGFGPDELPYTEPLYALPDWATPAQEAALGAVAGGAQ